MENWEPKPPGTLWAKPDLLRDSFTFYYYFHGGIGLYLCETVVLMSLPSSYRIIDKFGAFVE